MRIATAVFARMDSRRLPGKALAPLAGRPVLGRVLSRVRRAPFAVLVATSDRAIDDPIAALAKREGVDCFRGDAEDVAARALACMDQRQLDAIVRISGDSPFIDPAVIEAVVALYRAHPGADIATNVHPRSFPPGQSVEVIARGALARVLAETRDPADREHVTRYIYSNAGRFRVVNHAADADFGGVGLTVDTREDLARAEWMLGEGIGERSSLADIVAVARRYASIRAV